MLHIAIALTYTVDHFDPWICTLIVRYPLACETCGTPHTVRIGMGQEEYQSHRFACRGCGEEIAVGLAVDYEHVSYRVLCEDNATPSEEVVGAAIVNLDANFLVPDDQQGKDRAFPRLQQLRDMAAVAEEVGSLVPASAIPDQAFDRRPFRRPDFAGEWRQLKKAWSLHRNGRYKLSQKRIAAGSAEFYPDERLSGLPDWIWRLALHMCQPAFEMKFRDAMTAIEPLWRSEGLQALVQYYDTKMVQIRGSLYFDLMKDYFAAYSEFGQVQFLVTSGINISDDSRASSVDFDKTKMFYGNAFETFSDLVNLLAYLNNLLCGRAFDRFEQLTLERYEKLDKANRFGPFALNPAFTAICSEADNQIRNASHHRALAFDRENQTIHFRTGKGGTGPEQRIGYATYLQKCVHIFMQAMTLLRIELIVCNQLNIRSPL